MTRNIKLVPINQKLEKKIISASTLKSELILGSTCLYISEIQAKKFCFEFQFKWNIYIMCSYITHSCDQQFPKVKQQSLILNFCEIIFKFLYCIANDKIEADT